jgi:hypothetical protein
MPFYGWLVFHCVCMLHYLYPFTHTDGHLGWFHILCFQHWREESRHPEAWGEHSVLLTRSVLSGKILSWHKGSIQLTSLDPSCTILGLARVTEVLMKITAQMHRLMKSLRSNYKTVKHLSLLHIADISMGLLTDNRTLQLKERNK